MKPEEKITTGLNDRPRNETIGQSGEGLPDDTSQPIEVDEAQEARIREKLGVPNKDGPPPDVEEAADLPQKGSA